MTEFQTDSAFEKSMNRVYEAHNALLTKLFGSVPEAPGKCEVTRSAYKKAMNEVKEEFSLVEGDPDTVLFMLEQLSRSPRFIEEGEDENVKSTMGETLLSTTD